MEKLSVFKRTGWVSTRVINNMGFSYMVCFEIYCKYNVQYVRGVD